MSATTQAAMSVSVLTYDRPHRKTQDVLFQLAAHGHASVTVVALPWQERRVVQPLLPHRPTASLPIEPELFCRRLGYAYQALSDIPGLMDWLSTEQPDVILIGGAGLLPATVSNDWQILNAHPGMLPWVRGLDALKWALYDSLPLGVTLHRISHEADAGQLIHQIPVPLYPWDTFHSVAYRQYELEIALLAESLTFLKRGAPRTPLGTTTIVHRRMPHALERELPARLATRLQQLFPQTQAESCATSATPD